MISGSVGGIDHEVGSLPHRLDTRRIRLVGRSDERRRFGAGLAETHVATHQSLDPGVPVEIEVGDRVEPVAQLDPRLGLEQEVVPLDDDDAVRGAHADPARAGFVEGAVEVPFAEVPGWPVPKVEGHGGSLLVGKVGGTKVACLTGRSGWAHRSAAAW